MKHCEFKNCKAKIPLSLYDTLVCNTCLKHFCLLHRIPEDHKCDLDEIFIKFSVL